MATTDIIFFAIQSALKLGGAARQAYVDSTRNRGLVLPLPEFDPEYNGTIAADYFFYTRPNLRPVGIQPLLDKAHPTTGSGLSAEDEKLLIQFYLEALLEDPDMGSLLAPSPDGTFFTSDAVHGLVQIRQWERGAEMGGSPLQRVAGAIFEIAVDYYANVPGALNENSVQGKALRTLLTSIEGIDFEEVPIGTLPVQFFTATMETIAENPGLITGHDSTQELIKVTTSALGKDVKARIEAIRRASPGGKGNDLKQQRVIDWAELVFRSALSSGGRLALQDPKRFLGVDDKGTGALIDHVGVATLEFVLSQPEGEIDRVFGKEGLDIVVRAALTAVGEHPEILLSSGNEGLKKLLSETAAQLGTFDTLVAPGTLPEVTRMVLEKTGQNLPLIWSDTTNPKTHLLLVAATETLEILTKDTGEPWNPRFAKSDLLAVVDAVLDDFLANPGWLVTASGARSDTLRIALEAVVGVLRKQKDKRFTPETGTIILRSALTAVSRRKVYLDPLPGGQKFAEALIDSVLERVLDVNLDTAAAWSLVRQEVIAGIVDRAFKGADKTAAQQQQIDALETILDSQVADLISGQPFLIEDFLASVENAVATS